MPKNKGKGGKNRRRGKNENEVKRELIRKDGDDQEYAQVQKMLGNGRLQAQCFDGKNRLCHIRGKMRKKVWVNTGDIILVGLRGYQDGKADVILKYTSDEARLLKSEGCLPENTELNENDDQAAEVEFADFDEGEGRDNENEVPLQKRHYSITSSEDETDDDEEEEP